MKYTAKHLKKQLRKRIKQYSTEFIVIHKNTAKRLIRLLSKKEK